MKRLLLFLLGLYILSSIGFTDTEHLYVVVGQGENSYIADDTGAVVDFEILKDELNESFYFENTIYPEIRKVNKIMNGVEVEMMSYVFGIRDYKGNILAEAVNDKVLEKHWGYVLINGHRLIEMDKNGATLKEVPLDLPKDTRIVDVQYDAFIYEQKNGAQGRINEVGEIVEKAAASTITYLDDSVIHYRVNYELIDPEMKGQYGVLIKDSKNAQVIVALAPGTMGHKVDEDLFAARKGSGEWYLIEYDGFTMVERPVNLNHFTNIGKVSDGLIPFALRDKDGASVWGYMDRSEQVVIQPMFNHASSFKDNYAVVDLGGKKGLINKLGQYMILPELDKITMVKNHGQLFFKVQLGEYSGLMNSQFNWIVKPNYYTYANLSDDGIYIVRKESGQYRMGLLDYAGTSVIPCEYTSIAKLNDQEFIIEKENINYKLTPSTGQLSPFDYSKVRYAGFDYLAVSNDGIKWGVANIEGQLLTELKYDRIGMFRNYGTSKVQ